MNEVNVRIEETELETLYYVEDSTEPMTEDEFFKIYDKCVDCGEFFKIEDLIEVDGELYCQDCIDNNSDIQKCAECDEYHNVEDMVFIEEWGQWVCESCADYSDDLIYCAYCEEYHLRRDAIYLEDTEEWICNDCQHHNDYYYCEDCGRYFCDEDNIYYCEDDEAYYCYECINKHENPIIEDYHSMQDRVLEFHPGNRKENLHMGVEIEIAGGDDRGYVAERAVDIFNGHGPFINPEKDGSVDLEMITEPATLEYYQGLSDKFDKLFDIISDEGFNTDNANGAGGHIHVDKKWFEAQENFPGWEAVVSVLSWIFNRFYYEILTISRRPIENWRYGQSHHYYKWNKSDISETAHAYVTPENYWDSSVPDRYFALNLSNNDTIEFRNFGPYSNTWQLITSLKIAKRFCEFAISHNLTEAMASSWEEILGDDEDIKMMWETTKQYFVKFITRNLIADRLDEYAKNLYKTAYPELLKNIFPTEGTTENNKGEIA